MKAKHIVWILTAALIITAFGLTGCGDSAKDATETTEEKTAQKEEKKEEQTTEPQTEEPAPEPAPAPAPEPEAKTMYTTYDLAFRAEAKQDSDKIGAVPINTKVKVLDTSKDYYKIEYDGKEGYVLGEYLTESKKEAEKAAQEAAAQAAAQQKATGGNNGGGNKGGGTKKTKKECLDGGLIN